jgi:PIN domain nuclease of toxin-antitoxin system
MGPIEADSARFLIDTHVLLWWLFGDARLSSLAYDTIQSPDHVILVSSASGWEISTKHRLGKLAHAGEAVDNLPALLKRSHMEVLPVTLEHALAAGALPGPHRDPFDRMLIAQSQIEGLPIVTNDKAFRDYPVTIIW